jgi:hypothetical protein
VSAISARPLKAALGVFGAVLALLVLVVGAHAQNPVSPYYGLHPSVFPGGYNHDSFYACYQGGATELGASHTSTVYWDELECEAFGLNAIPDGFGGYTFLSDEINRYVYVEGGSDTVRFAAWEITIIPPTSIVSMTIGCDVVAERWDINEGTIAASTQATFSTDKASTANGVNWSGDIFIQNFPQSFQHDVWLTNSSVRDWDYFANEIGIAQTANPTNRAWRGPYLLSVAAHAGSDQNDRAATAAECWVTGYKEDTGSVFEPVYPTPVPSPTVPLPTATPGFDPIVWVPVQPITQEIDFDIGTPDLLGCYDIPPSIGPWTVTIPGWGDYTAEMQGVEWCISEQAIDIELLGIDFSSMIFIVFGSLFAGFLIRTLWA